MSGWVVLSIGAGLGLGVMVVAYVLVALKRATERVIAETMW